MKGPRTSRALGLPSPGGGWGRAAVLEAGGKVLWRQLLSAGTCSQKPGMIHWKCCLVCYQERG